MKRPIFFTILLFNLSSLLAVGQRVHSFSLSDVRLLDSPFYQAQELDKQYLLELDADRLLAPFRREAGLPPKAESYTNWENTGLDGHIGGHYLSALSLMYASTGDLQIKERLDYMIAELKHCQDANGDGYIGGVPGGKAMWDEVAAGNIRTGAFDLNGKWVPLYNIHKTYAGLRDAWLYTHDERAKEMLILMTDWAISLVSPLTEEQIQKMLYSEHGGLNETFADVAAITGEEKYLQLARRFSHRTILDPLLRKEDKLTGLHANTQIPKVLGYKRVADVEGNNDWSDAARFFWENVTRKRSVSTGGHSVSEFFNPTNDFSRLLTHIEGNETCNTYNMLRLSKMFYETTGEKQFMDYYERALYNHILSTQHPERGGLVYFTQMRPGHYRVYSQPHTSMWCCVGSGIENHARYGEMIYAQTENDLFVNLFIPSRLDWKEKNTEIIQTGSFPDEPRTTLLINPERKTSFVLHVRYPEWVGDGELTVSINGTSFPVVKNADGYVSIDRKWKKGDRVEIDLPMHIYTEQLPDRSPYYSFLYGPLVLAAKTGDQDLQGLYADDSRGGHVAHGMVIPMKDMPILVSDPDQIAEHLSPVEDKPLAFRLTGLYPAEKWPEQELIPFFRVHDSRYMIYWPQATAEEAVTLSEQIEKEEASRLRLDAVTVDRVSCGQQQPESDHFIQSERSSTGFQGDYHWRETRGGWFSYELRNAEKKAKFLYIAYLDVDRGRKFEVEINGQRVETIDANGGHKGLVTRYITIPDSEQTKETFTVRFASVEDARSAKIAEVRIVENQIIQ